MNFENKSKPVVKILILDYISLITRTRMMVVSCTSFIIIIMIIIINIQQWTKHNFHSQKKPFHSHTSTWYAWKNSVKNRNDYPSCLFFFLMFGSHVRNKHMCRDIHVSECVSVSTLACVLLVCVCLTVLWQRNKLQNNNERKNMRQTFSTIFSAHLKKWTKL